MSDQFILIKNNGVEKKLSIDEFEFDLVGSDERQMGTQNQYDLYNDELDMRCYLYEYPIGVFNYKDDWVYPSNIELITDKIEYSSFFIEK